MSLYIFTLLPHCFLSPLLRSRERKRFGKKSCGIMSTRRSRQSRPSTSRVISDDQILDLVSKLRQLVPEIRHSQSSKVLASKFLQETCNYIRGLQREVDDLSERLSNILSTIEADSAKASIINSLIMN